MSGMGRMLILLPAMLLMQQINFEDPDNLFTLRLLFAVIQALALAVNCFIYFRIKSNDAPGTVLVPPTPQPWGAPAPDTPPAPERLSIRDYDLTQWKKLLLQSVMAVLICGFLNYKWAIAPPLFIQIFMTPSSLYQNPLFKIYVLGQEVQRPFAEEPPFSGLMPSADEHTQDAQSPPQEESETSPADDKPAGRKRPAAKKKRAQPKKVD